MSRGLGGRWLLATLSCRRQVLRYSYHLRRGGLMPGRLGLSSGEQVHCSGCGGGRIQSRSWDEGMGMSAGVLLT